MKKLFSYFRLVKMINNAPMHLSWYKIIQNVMQFVTDVQKNGKPMLTKIAVLDMSKEKVIGDFDMVSIWAGVGDANPIERIRNLKSQNDFMKSILKKCDNVLDTEVDKNLLSDINLVLMTFE